MDFNATLLPEVLLLCNSRAQNFTERQNLYLPFWLGCACTTYNTMARINFGSFICFLYILLVHWACGKIVLWLVLMESFEFVFLSLGPLYIYLLVTWIYLLVTYLSLISDLSFSVSHQKATSVFFLNFEPWTHKDGQLWSHLLGLNGLHAQFGMWNFM